MHLFKLFLVEVGVIVPVVIVASYCEDTLSGGPFNILQLSGTEVSVIFPVKPLELGRAFFALEDAPLDALLPELLSKKLSEAL